MIELKDPNFGVISAENPQNLVSKVKAKLEFDADVNSSRFSRAVGQCFRRLGSRIKSGSSMRTSPESTGVTAGGDRGWSTGSGSAAAAGKEERESGESDRFWAKFSRVWGSAIFSVERSKFLLLLLLLLF